MLQTAYYDPFRVFAHSLARTERKATTEKSWTPAVDISETTESYQMHFDLPGVDAADIQVLEENGMLTISGERLRQDLAEGGKLNRVESASGAFSRQFTLPEDANTESIQAQSKNGVLQLEIDRKKPVDTRKTIEVKST